MNCKRLSWGRCRSPRLLFGDSGGFGVVGAFGVRLRTWQFLHPFFPPFPVFSATPAFSRQSASLPVWIDFMVKLAKSVLIFSSISQGIQALAFRKNLLRGIGKLI